MHNVEQLIVFGDSLQDNGNLIKTLKIPGEPFYKGRFSDGKVACEYLVDLIAQKQNSNVPKLLNFAVGGACTSGKNPKSMLKNHAFSVTEQIDRYVAQYGRFSNSDTVMMNGGGNNFLFALHNEKPFLNISAVYKVADDLLAMIDRLIKLGARKLIIWNVPDVTHAPAYDVSGFPSLAVKGLKKYIFRHINKQNSKLKNGVEVLKRKYPNHSLLLFDAYELLNNTIASPIAYGFENASVACVKSFGGVDEKGQIQTNIAIDHDPQTHLFWDYVHPTTKAQKMLTEHIFQTIYPI